MMMIQIKFTSYKHVHVLNVMYFRSELRYKSSIFLNNPIVTNLVLIGVLFFSVILARLSARWPNWNLHQRNEENLGPSSAVGTNGSTCPKIRQICCNQEVVLHWISCTQPGKSSSHVFTNYWSTKGR